MAKEIKIGLKALGEIIVILGLLIGGVNYLVDKSWEAGAASTKIDDKIEVNMNDIAATRVKLASEIKRSIETDEKLNNTMIAQGIILVHIEEHFNEIDLEKENVGSESLVQFQRY